MELAISEGMKLGTVYNGLLEFVEDATKMINDAAPKKEEPQPTVEEVEVEDLPSA